MPSIEKWYLSTRNIIQSTSQERLSRTVEQSPWILHPGQVRSYNMNNWVKILHFGQIECLGRNRMKASQAKTLSSRHGNKIFRSGKNPDKNRQGRKPKIERNSIVRKVKRWKMSNIDKRHDNVTISILGKARLRGQPAYITQAYLTQN